MCSFILSIKYITYISPSGFKIFSLILQRDSLLVCGLMPGTFVTNVINNLKEAEIYDYH